MNDQPKNKQGGARPGSGRKPLSYDEKLHHMNLCVPGHDLRRLSEFAKRIGVSEVEAARTLLHAALDDAGV